MVEIPPFQYPPRRSLRQIILAESGVDLRHCQTCSLCNERFDAHQDITLDMMVQLALMNDEEVLTCSVIWSENVLAAARTACGHGLNLQAVILALRNEARRRGLGYE